MIAQRLSGQRNGTEHMYKSRQPFFESHQIMVLPKYLTLALVFIAAMAASAQNYEPQLPDTQGTDQQINNPQPKPAKTQRGSSGYGNQDYGYYAPRGYGQGNRNSGYGAYGNYAPTANRGYAGRRSNSWMGFGYDSSPEDPYPDTTSEETYYNRPYQQQYQQYQRPYQRNYRY
ncbi:unnamed protein product, partial [Mesorhabditis spiculigera]